MFVCDNRSHHRQPGPISDRKKPADLTVFFI